MAQTGAAHAAREHDGQRAPVSGEGPDMRAVILAGGLGTRLRPYTTVIPKPLVPIGDRPVLEHIIRSLAQAPASTASTCA